jgi:DMSO/TMAO reductase YedYZ heme-binding membrane subunit
MRMILWLAKIIPLVPILVLVRPVIANSPGVQIHGGNALGFSATVCLVACLAITPLSRLMRIRDAASWRKWYGLCVLFLGATGILFSILDGPIGSWPMMVSGNVREWTGVLIVAALIPLATTSNLWSQKFLGSYWKIWQRRLTWAVWLLLAIHLAVLADWNVEVVLLMASAPLIVARVPAVRKDLSHWKSTSYEDSARWVLAGLLTGIFICGISSLIWMGVVASVRSA